MWLTFLQDPSAYARPFMDYSEKLAAKQIAMSSDATRNFRLGFGAICKSSWMFGQWNENFMTKVKPSIQYLELFALLAGVLVWIYRFRNRQILLFCDNESVVHMVNSNSSSYKNCMVLIHMLVLHSLKMNVRIFAKYIPSKKNWESDFLSRLKIQQFKERTQGRFPHHHLRTICHSVKYG